MTSGDCRAATAGVYAGESAVARSSRAIAAR